MKKTTIALTAITLALLTSLPACQNDGASDPATTGDHISLQTAQVVGIRPAETRDPSEPITFPTETTPAVESDTEFDSEMGVYPDQPVSLVNRVGKVLKLTASASTSFKDLMALEVVSPYSIHTMTLYNVYGYQYAEGDWVYFTYDERKGPVEDMGSTPVWQTESMNKIIYGETEGLVGTVEEPPYDWMDDQMLAIRIWYDGAARFMVLHMENAAEFCVGDEIYVEYIPIEEPWTICEGVPVWTPVHIGDGEEGMVFDKPVIYLYPETPTEISVKLALDGELTCTYPTYGEGWNNFTAHPDGTLYGPDGKEYYCLYWEGKQNTEWDFSEGFCVKGEDTAAFLEWALSELGLTPREANEFIIYWLPRMESNPYNVISFQTKTYTDTAVLTITPAPDTLLRVFMAWYPSEEAVNIPAQSFEPMERSGFTAVEWGGSEVGRP